MAGPKLFYCWANPLVPIIIAVQLAVLASCQGDVLETIADIIPDLIAGNNASNVPPGVTHEQWSNCRQAAERYSHDLLNQEPYALDMFDATSKLPDGIFNGNVFSPGNWDQCLSIRIPPTKEDINQPSRGQYCAVNAMSFSTAGTDSEPTNKNIGIGDFLFPGVRFFLGLCIPSQCPRELFESALNQALHDQGVHLTVARCLTDQKQTWTAPQLFGILFLSLFAMVVTMATLVDVANRHFGAQIDTQSNVAMKVLDCFSIYTNTEKFLDTSKASQSEIGCLHGMRFITISWIILGHVYSEPPMYDSSINKFKNLEEWFTPGMQLILNSTMSVDTFFTMSGFLVSYGLLKTLRKGKGRFPVVKFYVHR
jgi:hypothetical protein